MAGQQRYSEGQISCLNKFLNKTSQQKTRKANYKTARINDANKMNGIAEVKDLVKSIKFLK